MLVYNPSEAGLEKDQREVSRILKEMGIALLTVEVFNVNEIQAKVAAFIEKADALLVLKDNCVVSGLSVLVKFAEHYKIPLMASDLDSPDNGAAFAFGVPEIDYGIEAGKKALLILNEGVSPKAIPVTAVKDFKLRINEEAARRQGGFHDFRNP